MSFRVSNLLNEVQVAFFLILSFTINYKKKQNWFK